MTKVPKQKLQLSQLPLDDRLATFQALTAPLCDAVPVGDVSRFDVESTNYLVGDLVFSRVHLTPARICRSARHISQTDQNPLVLELLLEGEQLVKLSHSSLRIVPQRIYLRDCAAEFESITSEMSLISVLIPRHNLTCAAAMGTACPVLSWSLDAPSGRALSLLWSHMLYELEICSIADAEDLARSFMLFLDSLAGPHKGQRGSTTLFEMQSFLNTRLQSDVGLEDLCSHFGLSRATVYRHFAPLGGVKQYIIRSRLEQCYHDLSIADGENIRVSDVAASWGFRQAATFSRSFRARFGVTPSQVLGEKRATHKEGPAENGPGADGLQTWLHSIAGAHTSM